MKLSHHCKTHQYLSTLNLKSNKSNVPPKPVQTLSSKLINIYCKRLLGGFPQLFSPREICTNRSCGSQVALSCIIFEAESPIGDGVSGSTYETRSRHLTAILLHFEHIEEINHEGSKKFGFFETLGLGTQTLWRLRRWILGTGHIWIALCIIRTSAVTGPLGLARRNDQDNSFWLSKAVNNLWVTFSKQRKSSVSLLTLSDNLSVQNKLLFNYIHQGLLFHGFISGGKEKGKKERKKKEIPSFFSYDVGYICKSKHSRG